MHLFWFFSFDIIRRSHRTEKNRREVKSRKVRARVVQPSTFAVHILVALSGNPAEDLDTVVL